MLEHGGNLRDAVIRYQRPFDQWLDLSTGINPQPYPVPPLPENAWHRLPEISPVLTVAAQTYYGAPRVLAVAGTQAAIQALPRLRPASRVVIVAPSYAEHAHCWRQAGHSVTGIDYGALTAAVEPCDVMVICNPNNPTGAIFKPVVLLEWAAQLATRGGWLIVDEAFGDTAPELSVASHTDREGLIVLRSVGKFFGLAGLRLGFVAANEALLNALANEIGPWSVSGPAQHIGCAALLDFEWQAAMRTSLIDDGACLHQLLLENGIHARGTALFQWWPESHPEAFAQHMAERGIWVRLFADKARGIRLGLPLHEHDWQRVQQALTEWSESDRK